MGWRGVAVYNILPARKPQVGYALSGVVLVTAPRVRGYTYVKFPESTVREVGMQLPQGVSVDNPAYLALTKWPTGEWRLYARYINGGGLGVLLTVYEQRPEWVTKIRSKDSGTSTPH